MDRQFIRACPDGTFLDLVAVILRIAEGITHILPVIILARNVTGSDPSNNLIQMLQKPISTLRCIGQSRPDRYVTHPTRNDTHTAHLQ